jgi:hypothetical protein
MRLSRRFMLVALALSASLSTTALAVDLPAGRATARLRRLLPDIGSAREIGAIYRRACPAEADPPRLTRLLLSSLSLDDRGLAGRSDASLRALLTARVRRDFAAGDTVDISGWILSRTEARLCALWSERPPSSV